MSAGIICLYLFFHFFICVKGRTWSASYDYQDQSCGKALIALFTTNKVRKLQKAKQIEERGITSKKKSFVKIQTKKDI